MKFSLVLLLVFAVSVYGTNEFDESYLLGFLTFPYELTADEKKEVEMLFHEMVQEFLEEPLNEYIDDMYDELKVFNRCFIDDKYFSYLIKDKWTTDHSIMVASGLIEVALDSVKAKLTQDSYNKTQKEKLEIIQKDLTEAKENTDFLGEKMKVCLNKFPSVSEEDTEAKKEALSELKNYALDKPFLHLIQHIRDQNKQIMDHQVMNE